MDAEEAVEDDAAAWYLTFTPGNQYYQLRNAATGYYMTYSGGIKTVRHTTPTSADNFHLMRGRVNVEGHRGYYIIHPESSGNPPTLNATASGKTGTAAWSISNSATTQRWLILTAQEAEQFDNGNADIAKKDLKDLIAQIRELAETPHNENAEDVDATLTSALDNIETQAATCTKGKEFNALAEQVRNAAVIFLSNVSAIDTEHPFDLTFMLENPDFDSDATTGWTSTNGNPNYGGKAAEFYERTFDFYQVLDNMPKGNYELRAYAFQRPGAYGSVLAPYNNGTAKVTSSLYINNKTATVKHICDDRQPSALYTGDGYDQKLSDGTYIPNTMNGAAKYFAKGLYDSSVSAELTTVGGTLRVGIKCTSAPSWYWTMFDHFRLHFYGKELEGDGIRPTPDPSRDEGEWAGTLYDLSGRKIIHHQSSDHQLPHGIYIINGKKVVVR